MIDPGLTCIHATEGLCPACREEYDADPCAYEEYGEHPAGLARWAALKAEMEAERLALDAFRLPPPADEMPL